MNHFKRSAISFMGAILLVAGQNLAHAASECRGLEQPVCSGNAQCRWIAAYTRSDGREVSGYCRMLPESAGAGKVSPKKAS